MIDIILKEFKDKGIRQGQRPYYYIFPADDALTLIRRCRELDRKIYGIDVFRNKQGNEIVDYIDYTAKYYEVFDPLKYYDKYHVNKNKDVGHWEEAIRFVKDRMNSGYYFEIVYD